MKHYTLNNAMMNVKYEMKFIVYEFCKDSLVYDKNWIVFCVFLSDFLYTIYEFIDSIFCF
jgi:hypothetical protein